LIDIVKRKEIDTIESFLKEEMRFLDLDGTPIPIADMIDIVLERDKKKRQFSVG